MTTKHFTKINTYKDIANLLIKTFIVKMRMAPNPTQITRVCQEYINNPEGKDYFVIYKQDGKWKSKFLSNDEVSF